MAKRKSTKIIWLWIRIICPRETTCLPVYCCFKEHYKYPNKCFGPVQNRYHHHFTQNICSFPWYSWNTITHSPKRWIQNSALWMGISCIDLFLFIFQILLLCFAHNLRSDIKAQIAKWRYNRGALWSQERSYLIGYYF